MRIALAFLLVTTGSAAAAPVAQLARDLDGDGSSDTAELDDTGELRITTKQGTAKFSVGRLVRPSIASAIARGTPTVVVKSDTEVIVLQQSGAKWTQLLRTTIGGIGLDADYGVDIVATADGIFRYQTRGGFKRCDDKPALLFGERYEGGRFQRLARLPIGVPDTASTIVAKLDGTAAPQPLHYKARFASHQIGAADAGSLGVPSELDDGKDTTVWREELVSSAGEGQFFTYVPRFAGAKATQVRIVPGAQKGMQRPQRIAVVGKSGAWHIDIPEGAKDPPSSAYVVDLPVPIEGCVTLVLESSHGSDRGTTAIAELTVYAEGERSGGGDAALARVIADGSDGAKAAAQVLARRGASAVTAIDAELAKTKAPAARSRLLRALLEIRDPAAGPVLARAVTEGSVQGTDLVDVIRALAGLSQSQVLHDLAARQNLAIEARVAAARGLSAHDERERELLVGLAGRGPRELRQAVIDKLSSAPVAVLAAAAAAQTSNAGAGDVYRAITRQVHIDPTERPAALAAMTAALPTATDYERRYRLVDGIAAIGDAAALAALKTLLMKLPPGPETAAFKQIAARAIAANPRVEASDLLIALTTDREPGVRLAALSAIAGAAGTASNPWAGDAGADGIDRVIISMVSTDGWPEVRRAAAQVLGQRCMRPGPAAALTDAVARDKDVIVRGDALAALVDCKAPNAAALIAKLWDDSNAPIELRQRAVDLVVAVGDAALAAKLPAKFTKWRGGAIESEAALALAQSAAHAIGRAAPPGGADALVRALDDSAFPEIVAAAATGLGLLGSACPAAARTKLTALAGNEDNEQQVQIAAKRAAAVCGKR